ncbi:recombinase family protein [Klebsiella pneumoniae]|uniref:recombinase family protein n=1 Tax=Klebsiella pneumoniae TaxID=573 RepID=UPI003970AF53
MRPVRKNIVRAGFQPDKICVEHASAKDTNRPGLQELLGQLRLVIRFRFIPSIAFAGICRICALSPRRLRDQGRYPYFLKEQLTFSAGTNNPMQELQLHMMSAFSQFRRALLKERQADGIAAKKHGVKKQGAPAPISKRSRKLTHSEAEGSGSGSPATMRALAFPHIISFVTR